MLQPKETAPLDRTVIVRATQMIPGLGPIGPVFDTPARFYPEHGYWAAKRRSAARSAEFGSYTARRARLDLLNRKSARTA